MGRGGAGQGGVGGGSVYELLGTLAYSGRPRRC